MEDGEAASIDGAGLGGLGKDSYSKWVEGST